MKEFDNQIDLADYWQIIARRKYYFAIPFLFVVGIAAAIAFLLPAVYRSEASLIVERQAIPTNLVATTVSGYAQEQILQIRQRIITPKNLVAIAERFHLYPDEYTRDPISVVPLIRDNFEVEMVEVNATDPDRSGTRVATIAFTVAYSAETPESARAVANEFTLLYLEEDKRGRITTTENVTSFLVVEVERQRDEIGKLETLLADFKQEEMRQLPELMATNLRLYERTEIDIDRTEQQIRAYSDRIDAIKAELSLTSPYEDVRTEDGSVMLTAGERLAVLTASFLRLTARYSAQHPDIVRITREIRVLAKQSGEIGRIDEVMNELVKLQENLRQARQQYSEDHPEVKKLITAVAAMQKGFQTLVISGVAAENELEIPPDNPRYVALKTQLDSTQSNQQAAREKIGSLNIKLTEYEERLFQTPIVERNYKSLSRDYENALRKFGELKEKQLQAEIANELESGEFAGGFILASPAYLPTLPDSPNRIGILLLGIMLAFATGLGFTAIAEYLDNTIRNALTIADTMGDLPLVIIPKISPVPQ